MSHWLSNEHTAIGDHEACCHTSPLLAEPLKDIWENSSNDEDCSEEWSWTSAFPSSFKCDVPVLMKYEWNLYLNSVWINKNPLKREMPAFTSHDIIVICSSYDDKCVIICTVIEAASYGDPAVIALSGHDMWHEIPSNEHKSLEFIITLLEYISVFSPLVAIT